MKKKIIISLALSLVMLLQTGAACAPVVSSESSGFSTENTDTVSDSTDTVVDSADTNDSDGSDVNVTEEDAEISYYRTDDDGSYKFLSKEVTTVKLLNGEVILTDFRLKYEADGYALNEINSGKVLTENKNGQKVVSVYYYKPDLGLIDTKNGATFDYRKAFPDCNYSLEIYAETPYIIGKINEKERRRNVSEKLPSEGALQLNKLDGVYRLKASREGKTCAVIFDAYDSTKPFEWNDASDENNVIYARGNRNFTGKLLTYKTAQLEDEGHVGSYWEIHWNRYAQDGDGNSYDSMRNGASMTTRCGFSVLSRHSKAYYEKILADYKWSTLSFAFKLNATIDEETDQLQNGGTATLWPNMLYGNSVHTGYLTGAQLMGSSLKPKNIVEGEEYIGGGKWRTEEIRIKTLIENWDWMGVNFTEGRGMDYFRSYYEENGLKVDASNYEPIWRGTMVSWEGDWAKTIKPHQLRDFWFTVGEFAIKLNEK